MITYSDCILLLGELEDSGINVSEYAKNVLKSKEVDFDTLKFINDHRQLDVTAFYNKIRRSYNNKKSDIYINIVKEVEDPYEVIITLSALLTQILLFSKNVEDRQMFFKHSRAEEITKVLKNYFVTYDITYAIKLLHLIKADIKALESIK